MDLEWSSLETPVGNLTGVECRHGPLLLMLNPATHRKPHWIETITRHRGPTTISLGRCDAIRNWLQHYFAGEASSFPFPEYLPEWWPASPAQISVWRNIATIPFGETTSYGALAKLSDSSPRAVGQLVGSNPLPILIPCHRVIGADGSLVGYSGGVARKRKLLSHELAASGLQLR